MNLGAIIRVACSASAWLEVIGLLLSTVNTYLRYRLLKEQDKQAQRKGS